MPFDIKQAQEELDTFTGSLSIDKHQLDIELEDTAALYFEISRNYTRCVALRDNAKQDYELVQAKIDRLLRHKYADVKTTETMIKNEVAEHPEVQGAWANHAAWVHMSGLWRALVDAWSTRNYALQDLCKLHIAGYYAGKPVTASEATGKVIKTHG